jgi:hypothetical protein
LISNDESDVTLFQDQELWNCGHPDMIQKNLFKFVDNSHRTKTGFVSGTVTSHHIERPFMRGKVHKRTSLISGCLFDEYSFVTCFGNNSVPKIARYNETQFRWISGMASKIAA